MFFDCTDGLADNAAPPELLSRQPSNGTGDISYADGLSRSPV